MDKEDVYLLGGTMFLILKKLHEGGTLEIVYGVMVILCVIGYIVGVFIN